MHSTEHNVDNPRQPADAASLIDHLAAEHEAAWIVYRRERHCSPEASGEETETSHSICERLKSLGIASAIPERQVGVVGDLLLGNATQQSPAIAIRADIDALRLPDRKDVGYASIKEGLAHACGHDVHTTVVLAVAELLCRLKKAGQSPLPNARIRFLFQAAEETCDGANWMIEDGMLQNVRSIIGLHVEPNLLAGQVGIRYGVFTAGVDEVFIRVRGRGGHTARPHSTSDPVHAAAMLVNSLYQILPRSVDVRDASVFTVGQIHGGQTANVIPDEVTLGGTLRTVDPTARAELMNRIRSTGEHLAAMTGNEITVEFRHPLGSVVNAPTETAAFEAASREVLGDDGVLLLDRPSMGGEDFAMYLDHCPGAQIRLGCAGSLPWPHLHSPMFDVDEKAIAVGARIIARTALKLAANQAPTSN
ncbi:MAG: amidohydrolase [Fuerstiella sp.]